MSTKFRVLRQLKIEFGDCDPAGIVFNPRYFAFFDAGTMALMEAALGAGKKDILERFGFKGWAVGETGAKFLIPCSYSEIIGVESTLVEFGRSTIVVQHRVLKDGGAVAVEGRETRVWIGLHPDDPKRMKALPIPDAVREAFAGDFAEPIRVP